MRRGARKKLNCHCNRHEVAGRHESFTRLGGNFNASRLANSSLVERGDSRAHDSEIMAWARQNGYVVFTHDLDFGTLLALTQAEGPSVIQVRTQDVTPSAIGKLVVNALRQFQSQLEKGALIVLDESQVRARILPLKI
jgi:predicted nuclease of predicted toxin-antitoxin system